jgi:hypothetical protein
MLMVVVDKPENLKTVITTIDEQFAILSSHHHCRSAIHSLQFV